MNRTTRTHPMPVARSSAARTLRSRSAALLAALLLSVIGQAAHAQSWTTVALEGQTFSVSGTQVARFGYGNNWVQQSVSGSVVCSASTFGNGLDPVFKQCDLQGSGLPATTTSVASSTNPSVSGAPVTLTASVSGAAPSGSVTFMISSTTGVTTTSVALAGSGNTRTASTSVALCPDGGWCKFAAAYSGDGGNAISLSSTLSQTVNPNSGAGSSGGTSTSNLIVNGSFETPTVGEGNYAYTPSGATWVFVNAGLSGNDSGFTQYGPSAPAGAQVAFIQNAGTASQSLTLAAGTYSLSFQAVQRANYQYGTQSVRVTVDGATIGTFQPPSGAYGASPAYTFSVAAGTHTLQLAGVGTGSDYTAFIDGVSLTGSTSGPSLPSPPVSAVPVVNYEYDAQGNPTKVVQAPGVSGYGFATQSAYDSLNRATAVTDARAGITQIGYDGLDRTVQVTDPRSLVTQTPRNGLGDATAVVSPDTGAARSTYDAAGNLATRTDSRGVLGTYSYDPLNRPRGVSYTQSGQASQSYAWSYDQTGAGFSNGIGRLTSTTHPTGSTQYAYDPQGRVLTDTQTVNAASGANAATITAVVGYGYDAAGHVTSITYPSGRVVSVSYSGGLPSAIGLAATANANPVGLLGQIQFSPFGGPLSWQWQTTTPQANARIYDTSGRPVRYRLGNVVRDLAYDAAGRITGYTHYDAAAGAATAGASALDQGFGYDELGRLTAITTASSSWSIGYDANGNRTSVTLNGSTSNYTTSPTSNRLTGMDNPARSFGYDNAGNTTSDSAAYTSSYDLSGRLATLTKAGATSTFSYDALGRRVRKFVSAGTGAGPATTVVFAYDQDGQLLGEYDQAGNAIREYVWLGSTPVALFTPDPANGAGNSANPPLVYFVHTDHLDTPRVVTDTAGNVRWRWMAEPFGTTAPETNPASLGAFNLPLRFPGQYADQETGLSYNFARYYAGDLGRYTQSDPIGLGGGVNTYLYVGGRPTDLVDPAGLQAFPGSIFTQGVSPGYGVGMSTPGFATMGMEKTSSGSSKTSTIVFGSVEVSSSINSSGGTSAYIGIREPGFSYSRTTAEYCSAGNTYGWTAKVSAAAGAGKGAGGTASVSIYSNGSNSLGLQGTVGIASRSNTVYGISIPSPGFGYTFKP